MLPWSERDFRPAFRDLGILCERLDVPVVERAGTSRSQCFRRPSRLPTSRPCTKSCAYVRPWSSILAQTGRASSSGSSPQCILLDLKCVLLKLWQPPFPDVNRLHRFPPTAYYNRKEVLTDVLDVLLEWLEEAGMPWPSSRPTTGAATRPRLQRD